MEALIRFLNKVTVEIINRIHRKVSGKDKKRPSQLGRPFACEIAKELVRHERVGYDIRPRCLILNIHSVRTLGT